MNSYDIIYKSNNHHIPAAHSPQPTLSVKAQWTLLHHYLSLRSGKISANLSWLDSISRKLLLTALAKKSAELELLREEVEHADLATDIEFPDFDVAFASPTVRSPEIEGFPISDMQTHLHDMTLADGNAVRPTSPTSPTFGPRQGTYFSGTVNRRRSSVLASLDDWINDHIDHEMATENEQARRKMGAWNTVNKDWERRLQWQAAWFQIESHLDYYADRFLAKDVKHGERSRREIWEELASMRKACEDMSGQLKKTRAGSSR